MRVIREGMHPSNEHEKLSNIRSCSLRAVSASLVERRMGSVASWDTGELLLLLLLLFLILLIVIIISGVIYLRVGGACICWPGRMSPSAVRSGIVWGSLNYLKYSLLFGSVRSTRSHKLCLSVPSVTFCLGHPILHISLSSLLPYFIVQTGPKNLRLVLPVCLIYVDCT